MTTPVHSLDLAHIAIDDLHPHPENARRGNVQAIAESLAKLGQYRPVVVNAGTFTGRPMEILAGHHIVKAAGSLGWSQVAISLVDVDADQARRILAADNHLPELGGFDNAGLLTLLESIGDLEGTGYRPDDADDLRVLLESAAGIADPAPRGDEVDANPDGRWTGSGSGGIDFDQQHKNQARRIMLLDVPVELFVWLQAQMQALATDLGLDSNVDVVIRLLADASGVQPPVAAA
jgi:hypothetical protein